MQKTLVFFQWLWYGCNTFIFNIGLTESRIQRPQSTGFMEAVDKKVQKAWFKMQWGVFGFLLLSGLLLCIMGYRSYTHYQIVSIIRQVSAEPANNVDSLLIAQLNYNYRTWKTERTKKSYNFYQIKISRRGYQSDTAYYYNAGDPHFYECHRHVFNCKTRIISQ